MTGLPVLRICLFEEPVFLIQMISGDFQCFTEPLEVDQLPGTQKLKRSAHIGICNNAQKIVIGGSGFLLGRKILRQISDGVTLTLKFACIKRNTCRCRGPEGAGMVHIIGIKTGCSGIIDGHILCKLVNHGSNHFHVGQLLRTDIRQQTGHFFTGHGITLG